MPLTEAQLALRRTTCTGTDAPKICGVSPFGGPLDVQLAKRGADVQLASDRMKWGNILERPIREDFAERHRCAIAVPGTLAHPTEQWAGSTPDGILYPLGTTIDMITPGVPDFTGPIAPTPTPRPTGGHEIKTHTGWMAYQYGEKGSDEVPPGELVQCAWNRWVAAAVYGVDFATWDLTAFMDGLPCDYQIVKDGELEEMVVGACRVFWQEHIIDGREVEPDGSKTYSDHLRAQWPRDRRCYREATGEEYMTVVALHDQRREIAGLEADETRLVQLLKRDIGDHAGVEFPAIGAPTPVGRRKPKKQRITWKRSQDSERVDWRGVAAYYRGQLEITVGFYQDAIPGDASEAYAKRVLEDLDRAMKEHTTIKPGSRRFNVPRNWSR